MSFLGLGGSAKLRVEASVFFVVKGYIRVYGASQRAYGILQIARAAPTTAVRLGRADLLNQQAQRTTSASSVPLWQNCGFVWLVAVAAASFNQQSAALPRT